MIHLVRRTFAAAAALIAAAAVLPAASAAVAPGDTGYAKQWNMGLIGAEAAWDAGLMGAGVEIAVLDTGVHLSHQDLQGRLAAGTNFVEPGQPPQDHSVDDGGQPLGHGTHVAAIAAAGYGDGGVVGVAPKATVVPVKVLDDEGSGSPDDVAAGIRWAADNGVEVINLSLGNTIQSFTGPSAEAAIDYAWSKGSICVFAAGNNVALPSGFERHPAIVVASVSRNDDKSYYSNNVGRARWALAAPGGPAHLFAPVEDEVFSAAWEDDARPDTYRYMQGTSQAAPHVAGAAALLRAAGLSPQQTVDRLLETSKDLGPSGRDSTYGSGRVDVARAVQGLSATGAPTTTTTSTTSTPAPTSTTMAGPTTTSGTGPRRSGTTTTTTTSGAVAASPDTSTTAAPPSSAPTSSPRALATGPPNTVVIDDGSAGGRPWTLIALGAAALLTVGLGAVLARRLGAPATSVRAEQHIPPISQE